MIHRQHHTTVVFGKADDWKYQSNLHKVDHFVFHRHSVFFGIEMYKKLVLQTKPLLLLPSLDDTC